MTLAEWRAIMDVNLTGAFSVRYPPCRISARLAGGTIVARRLRRRAAPAGRPHGLLRIEGRTRDVRQDAGRRPGRAECPRQRDLPRHHRHAAVPAIASRTAPDPEAELERILDRYVIRRVGRPEDIAYAALYLSSAESAYVTGSALAVDAGRTFH